MRVYQCDFFSFQYVRISQNVFLLVICMYMYLQKCSVHLKMLDQLTSGQYSELTCFVDI